MKILHYIDENNLSWARPFIQLLSELKNYCENIIICRPNGTFAELLRNSDFEVHEYRPLISTVPILCESFSKILKLVKPDIIHTRLSSAARIAGFWGKKLRVPVVSTIDKFPKKKYYENADYILPCSTPVKDFMLSQGIENSKMIVIPNAVDVDFYKRDLEIRNKIRNSENVNDKIIFLGMGRFVDWKGFDDLLKGFAEFLKSQNQPNKYFLWLAGDGVEKNNLTTLAKSLNIFDYVKFWGFVKDVRPILWSSDIYIHPSWGEEAFGLSLLEAMSSGLPVIASESGGITEILNNSQGLLFPKHNINSLVNCMSEAISKRNILSNNSILRANDFNIKIIAEKTIQVYSNILSK